MKTYARFCMWKWLGRGGSPGYLAYYVYLGNQGYYVGNQQPVLDPHRGTFHDDTITYTGTWPTRVSLIPDTSESMKPSQKPRVKFCIYLSYLLKSAGGQEIFTGSDAGKVYFFYIFYFHKTFGLVSFFSITGDCLSVQMQLDSQN